MTISQVDYDAADIRSSKGSVKGGTKVKIVTEEVEGDV